MEFTNELDIAEMKRNEAYERIDDEAKETIQEVPLQVPYEAQVLKKLGRPKKVASVSEAVDEI